MLLKQLFQDDITFVNVIFCFNSVKSELNTDDPSMTLTFTSKGLTNTIKRTKAPSCGFKAVLNS